MKHTFTYSLLCHDQPLTVPSEHGVFENAAYLNTPVWAVIASKEETVDASVNTSFVQLKDCSNIVVTAFKQSELSDKKYVIRLAEMQGIQSMAVVQLHPSLSVKDIKLCNSIEEEIADSAATP